MKLAVVRFPLEYLPLLYIQFTLLVIQLWYILSLKYPLFLIPLFKSCDMVPLLLNNFLCYPYNLCVHTSLLKNISFPEPHQWLIISNIGLKRIFWPVWPYAVGSSHHVTTCYCHTIVKILLYSVYCHSNVRPIHSKLHGCISPFLLSAKPCPERLNVYLFLVTTNQEKQPQRI